MASEHLLEKKGSAGSRVLEKATRASESSRAPLLDRKKTSKTIHQYQKPLPLLQDLSLFSISALMAILTFYKQGTQSVAAVEGLDFLFSSQGSRKLVEETFRIIAPIPLIMFSTLTSYELWDFLVKDPGLFFKTLCKNKTRLFLCGLAAWTSAYVASESSTSWWVLLPSVISSLTTNGSFFIFRDSYSNHKDELSGAINWMKDNEQDYSSSSGEDPTARFKEILEKVTRHKDRYLDQNKKTNCGVEFFAWCAALLPTIVYFSGGAEAWCWLLSGFPNDRGECAITMENLSDHWWKFLPGFLTSGLASFVINAKVNYLATHRLSEEYHASKLDPVSGKLGLHTFSSIMCLSYIMFNFGVNLNNPIFNAEPTPQIQAILSLFVAPIIYFSLYAFPRKLYHRVINRTKQDINKNDRKYFLETLSELPPAKLARIVKDIEREGTLSHSTDEESVHSPGGDDYGTFSGNSSDGESNKTLGCCSCLFRLLSFPHFSPTSPTAHTPSLQVGQ